MNVKKPRFESTQGRSQVDSPPSGGGRRDAATRGRYFINGNCNSLQ